MALTVSVISPEKILFSGQADHVKIPGSEGYFGVLTGHASLVAEVDIGILEITSAGSVQKIVVEGGFAEIKSNKVNILTNSGELSSNIDPEKSKLALEQALNSVSKDKYLEIKKAKNRVSVHKKEHSS